MVFWSERSSDLEEEKKFIRISSTRSPEGRSSDLEEEKKFIRISSTRSPEGRSSDLEEEKKFEEFFGILLFFEVLMNLSDSSGFLRPDPLRRCQSHLLQSHWYFRPIRKRPKRSAIPPITMQPVVIRPSV
jgi:hypothetical protein